MGAPIRICANLPYNVATPLLTGWLECEPWPPFYDRLVFMFQREVALRIVATPAERADYGRLGVLAGWRAEARILFDVPPAAFTPPPKVTSSVVELVPRAAPDPCDPRVLSAATLAAFGQRRKMLRQSLKAFAGSRGLDLAMLLAKAGLDPTKRAEEVSVAGFAALARAAVRLGRLAAPGRRGWNERLVACCEMSFARKGFSKGKRRALLRRHAELDQPVNDRVDQRLERGVDDVARYADRRPALAGRVAELDQNPRHGVRAAWKTRTR